jgi:hypothetical protein
MLGRSLRVELASEGASAGVLYPGWVATPMADSTRGGNESVTQLKERAFRGPLGTYIPPEQIADAVVAGIETRAARIIEPKRWSPVSAMRGNDQHPRRQIPRARPGDPAPDQARRRRGTPAPSLARNSAAIWVGRRRRLADARHSARWRPAPERRPTIGVDPTGQPTRPALHDVTPVPLTGAT